MLQIDPIGNVRTLIELFTEVATSDPLSGILIAIGGLLTLAAVGALGVLAVGGAFSFLGRLVEAPTRQD